MCIAVGLYLYSGANQDRIDVPTAPEAPDLGPLLPSQSPRDEQVLVRIDQAQSGVGTAFAIDDTGNWLTARHVVDSCSQTLLRVDDRRTLPVTVRTFPQADIALLSAEWSRKPLPSDLDTRRKIGETGFFFGFPQGRPGEVVGSLIARNRMSVRGRYKSDEAILAWSELGRSRGLRGSLGGMSGAPVLDIDGEIIGIVTAEAPRRGRVYTVAPRYLRGLITEKYGTPEPLTLDSFSLSADRLRRDRRIAQVICIVQ